MRKVNLFANGGSVVAKILVPDPMPGIVVFRGLYFHLVNGAYHQATLYEHSGPTED